MDTQFGGGRQIWYTQDFGSALEAIVELASLNDDLQQTHAQTMGQRTVSAPSGVFLVSQYLERRAEKG